MLEVVCIQITVNQCGVRLHIVGELNNIQGVALSLECVLCRIQDFSVRSRGSANGDRLVVACCCAAAVSCSAVGLAAAASGQGGQAQGACQDCCDCLLHGNSLLF